MKIKLEYKIAILFIVISTTNVVHSATTVNNQCRLSQTTVSGKFAPKGDLCSGQLLLDENFNDFNRDLWEHEITLGGGGVSKILLQNGTL